MHRHFRADPLQRFYLEVCISHPRFDGSERALDRLAPLLHFLGMFFKTLMDFLKKVFVFPACNPMFLARGALGLDGAALARMGPIVA